MRAELEEEYANAYGLISANYEKLFSQGKFQEFVNARSIEEILVSLEGTPYEPEFKKIFGREIEIKEAELALKEHFLRVYQEISEKIPPRDKKALDWLFLEELKVKDLVVILKGWHAQNLSVKKAIEKPFVFSGLPEGLVNSIWNSENLEKLLSNLKDTWYHQVLERQISAYQESNNLLLLENALLHHLIEKWDKIREESPSSLQEFIGMKIDTLYLRLILRVKLSETLDDKALKSYSFPSGYYLHQEDLELIKRSETKEITKILSKLPYFTLIQRVIQEYPERRSLATLEVGLDKLITQVMKEKSLIQPLSLYSVLSFLNEKEREVRDLHSIFVSKKYSLPPEEIKSICQIFSKS